jgi:broad-specificity NMP kinase
MWGKQPNCKGGQRVIVLAGLPGSGKTFVAKRLQTVGWIWINQVYLTALMYTRAA